MINIRNQALTSPDPWEVPSPWWFGEEELLQIKKQNQVLLEFYNHSIKALLKINFKFPKQ